MTTRGTACLAATATTGWQQQQGWGRPQQPMLAAATGHLSTTISLEVTGPGEAAASIRVCWCWPQTCCWCWPSYPVCWWWSKPWAPAATSSWRAIALGCRATAAVMELSMHPGFLVSSSRRHAAGVIEPPVDCQRQSIIRPQQQACVAGCGHQGAAAAGTARCHAQRWQLGAPASSTCCHSRDVDSLHMLTTHTYMCDAGTRQYRAWQLPAGWPRHCAQLLVGSIG